MVSLCRLVWMALVGLFFGWWFFCFLWLVVGVVEGNVVVFNVEDWVRDWEGVPPAVYMRCSESGSECRVGSERYLSSCSDQSVISPVMMYLRCSRES